MKTKSILLFSVLTGLVCFVSSVVANFDLASWHQYKNISVPSLGGSSYVKVDFDNELAATGKTNDIRIIDNLNQETPYKIVSGKEINYDAYENSDNQQGVLEGDIIDLTYGQNKTVAIVDSRANRQILNKLEITSYSKNVKGKVSVYSSDKILTATSPSWRLISSDGYLYQYLDSKAGLNIGNGTVTFPKSVARYYKVVIETDNEDQVTIDRVGFYYQTERHTQSFSVTAPIIARAENKDRKVTDLIIDRGAPGLPVSNLTLKLADLENNFTRSVAVFSSDVFVPGKDDAWREVGRGGVYGIKAKLFSGTGLSIGINEVHSRYIRVVVYNGDDQPVNFGSEVILTGIQDSLIFKADPAKNYKLFYGNNSASYPQYDLNDWFKYLDIPGFITANLGSTISNPNYVQPKPEPLPFKNQYPYAPNIILILTVVVIGSIAFVYIRKNIKKTGK